MRITKALAEQVAKQMAKPAFDNAVELFGKYRESVLALYLKRVPDDVKKLSEDPKTKVWIRQADYFRVNGPGMSGWSDDRAFRLDNSIPCNTNQTPTIELTLDDKEVLDAFSTSYRAKQAAEKLQEEIEQTLINLRTRANIEKELPEAVPFLPNSTSTALVVNTDPLRAKLAELQKQSTPTA